MDHSGSSCRGTTHPLISPPKANCPTHPKTTWGLKYPMELNHIESCISVSTWIFGILWVFLHVYIIWLNWYVIDDIFNICTTYICTYISYIVYILTCTVNPTIKSSGKRPSQHAYPAGYSLADGDRLIVVPDGTDCFTSGLGGSVIQRWCLWRFFLLCFVEVNEGGGLLEENIEDQHYIIEYVIDI